MYTSSPIHLKDDTKQNKRQKNNNKHKQDIIEGGKILTYGCISSIVTSRKENLPLWIPNNGLTFILNVHNIITGFHK
jgi:preprotein translocase subunit YajC